MLRVVRYKPENKLAWDEFIATARNATFLFYRDYMDYHQHRFIDSSLMVYDEQTIIAVLPANVQDDALISHGGLTYGGVLVKPGCRSSQMLEIFTAIIEYCRFASIRKLRYKSIPYIYQNAPGDEDLYCLFRHDAKLVRRDLSSVIQLDSPPPFSKGRIAGLKKAQKMNLEVKMGSINFEEFIELETEMLSSKYKTKPVHSASELSFLAAHFPDNIKLFTVHQNSKLSAGVVMYMSRWVAHAQYMGADDDGKQSGALDLIVDHILRAHCHNKQYFDFGISTEQEGRYLNDGLILQKEMFGARGVLYDTYELVID
jgi:hypothetical protein